MVKAGGVRQPLVDDNLLLIDPAKKAKKAKKPR